MNSFTDPFSGDGDSSVYRAGFSPNQGSDSGAVGFSLTGTWSDVTATLYCCMDSSASPQVWAAVPFAAYTSDTADSWTVPDGALFKVTVSGSGSPLPSLALTVRGALVKL